MGYAKISEGCGVRPIFKIGVFFGLFLAVAGAMGYLTLKLIVKSEDVVVVPDLVGKDVVYALEILTGLGLNIKVAGFEYRADIPKNHVADQEPRPGAEVKRDRDVRIMVSKGSQTVVVPNLVGMDVREANIIMEENGLEGGAVSKSHSEEAVSGEVISQAPAPGGIVKRGDMIDLLVSLGRWPVRFKMLYLDGLAPEDAILIIERSQLNLGQIRYVQRTDTPKGVVVEQDPSSGYPVTSGSLVNLTVNRSEKGVVLGKGLYFLHHHVPDGFLKKHIRLRVNAFGLLYDLHDVFQPPGEDIWLIVPYDPDVTFFLYQDGEAVLSRSFASISNASVLSEFEIGKL
jgi:beta-lactam-binding protein with PASTA domain